MRCGVTLSHAVSPIRDHVSFTAKFKVLEITMEISGSSSSSEIDLELENACAILNIVNRKKRVWIHKINLKRKEKGEFHHLVQELEEPPDRYEMYFRMTNLNFYMISLKKI